MERFFSKHLGNKGKIANMLLLFRFWNGMIIGIIAILGYLLLNTTPSIFDICLLFLSFVIVYGAGTTLNDLRDYHVDKINMPYRPLQQNKISLNEAKTLMVLLYVVAFAISASSLFLLSGVILFFIFSILYSQEPIALVRRGFLGNVTLGIVTILIPAITGSFLASKKFELNYDFIIPIISLTILFSIITILKDFKDIQGDKKNKKNTTVVLIGERKATKLTLFFTTAFFLISIYLFNKVLENVFFVLISLILLPFFIKVELLGFSGQTEKYEKMFGDVRILVLLFIIIIFFFRILAYF